MKSSLYALLAGGLLVLPAACGDVSDDASPTDTGAGQTGAADSDTAADARHTSAGIELPNGFSATVFAEGLGSVRHMAVRDDGTLYTIRRRDEGILVLRDTDGDGVADSREQFSGLSGTGIEIHDGYLYAGTPERVVRWPLPEAGQIPESEPELVIDFPAYINYAGGRWEHPQKTFAFDGAGNMYVKVGSPSNACMEERRTPGSAGQNPCPELDIAAGIWQVDLSGIPVSQADAHHYATGIRNGMGIAWSTAADSLYVISHGRDMLGQLFPEYYTEEDSAALPAEEFHRIADGADAGWPYTYWDPRRGARIQAPEYGGDGETMAEGDYQDPVIGFPGHWAPNDLIFYEADQFPAEYRNGAFIAFHGSWNRAPLPQQGYNVVFVPMENGMPAGDWRVFADGFKGAEVLENSGDAEHRPTGLATGPDGALYIADDMGGTIWRVTYDGPQ